MWLPIFTTSNLCFPAVYQPSPLRRTCFSLHSLEQVQSSSSECMDLNNCVSGRALQGVRTCDPTVLAGIRAVTDLCLFIQRSAVQVTGKITATMVLQEHARWLSLADLTEHEKPVVSEGIFFLGTSNATTRQKGRQGAPAVFPP